VAGYSGYRIFEETIRIDSSAYFLGLRLNFFVAIVMTVAGLAWFAIAQRRGGRQPGPPSPAQLTGAPRSPGRAAGPGTGRQPPPSPATG
jgi:prolipoprotein diacylglyceryltransferase